jgi:hypothetical protein
VQSPDSDGLIFRWRYSATLQLRTPLAYLERDGEISHGSQEPPLAGPAQSSLSDGTEFNSYGAWLRVIDYERLGFGPPPLGNRGTQWGPVKIGSKEEKSLLSFLKSFRYIVETSDGIDQTLSELALLSTSSPGNRHWWSRCSEGDPLWPDSYFIGELRSHLPKGAGKNMAQTLYQAGLRTIDEVKAAPDPELLSLPGLGKGMLAKIRDIKDATNNTKSQLSRPAGNQET